MNGATIGPTIRTKAARNLIRVCTGCFGAGGDRGPGNKTKVDNIEDFGFARGYMYAIDYWREVLDGLNGLRKDHLFRPGPVHAAKGRF